MNKVLNWLFDYPNLKVYQYEEGFKFSLDSILLAEFAEIRKTDEKIIDLCTGNAVIPILIHHKYQKEIVGVEIQPEIAELARDSVEENHMGNKIKIIEDSILELENYFPGNNFDVVLSNPPYFKYHNEAYVNNNKVKGIARHEIMMNLEQLFKIVNYLLKEKGRFYLVHIPERIEEIFLYAHQNRMAVKELVFVTSKEDEKPIIVLASIVKGGRLGCKVYNEVSIENLATYQNIFQR